MLLSAPRRGEFEGPRQGKPRRRIDWAAVIITLVIVLTPDNTNAIVAGILASMVLLTIRWVQHRLRGEV